MTTNPTTNPDFIWEDKHPTYPAGDVRDDVTRYAMDAIARKAVPFFDVTYAYFSDLMWDAQNAATMDAGDTAFIVVRSMGTSWFTPVDQSADAIARKAEEARAQADARRMADWPAAVLRVRRDAMHGVLCSLDYESHT